MGPEGLMEEKRVDLPLRHGEVALPDQTGVDPVIAALQRLEALDLLYSGRLPEGMVSVCDKAQGVVDAAQACVHDRQDTEPTAWEEYLILRDSRRPAVLHAVTGAIGQSYRTPTGLLANHDNIVGRIWELDALQEWTPTPDTFGDIAFFSALARSLYEPSGPEARDDH